MKINNNSSFLIKLISLSLLIVLSSLLFFYFSRVDFNKGEQIISQSEEKFTIVIDAGHGGRDGGANVGDVYEKDLALEIAKKLYDFLNVFDVDVLMTRSEDVILADDSSRNKKRDDLFNRAKIVKECQSPILISIHLNKFPESKYNGLQVFYSSKNRYSESLALMVQSYNKSCLEPTNTREVKRSNSSIYLLEAVDCPAILIECGFMSNPDDLEKLSDNNYQNALSCVIANSIIEYIKL